MNLTRSARRSAALFIGSFLFCAAAHVVLFHIEFIECFAQLFCGSLTLLWALSIQKRVTDFRLKTLLLWIAVCSLSLFVLQILRYNMLRKGTGLSRLAWYAYYVPMMAAALLCFFAALYIHLPPGKKPGRGWIVLGTVCALISAGFLTNDLHFLAFRYPTGTFDENHVTYGPLIILYFLCFSMLMIASFLIILRKCRRSPDRKFWLVPVIPMAILVLFLILQALGKQPKIHSASLWNMGEVFSFSMLGFLECCIQIGLIPANQEYDRLFRLTGLPAVIRDDSGTAKMRTAGAEDPFPKGRDWEIHTRSIPGGSVLWATDMSSIRALNEQLAETTQRMEARNAYLAQENQIRAERAELEVRNRLYDGITAILRPQLEQIEAMLREGDMEARLPRIAVLCAYVKRRSNMELLSAEGTLPSEELSLAIRESLEYVRLCGVNTAATSVGSGVYAPGILTAAYDAVERLIEDCLDTLTDLMVSVRAEEDTLTVRMLFRAGRFAWNEDDLPPVSAGVSRRASVSVEGQDGILVLTFSEGGGSA